MFCFSRVRTSARLRPSVVGVVRVCVGGGAHRNVCVSGGGEMGVRVSVSVRMYKCV